MGGSSYAAASPRRRGEMNTVRLIDRRAAARAARAGAGPRAGGGGAARRPLRLRNV